MSQTWKINGQIYNRSQLQELKRQGLDPRKDDIVMKFITNPGLERAIGDPGGNEAEVPAETEEEEFARLKASSAWLHAATKERYNELKAKFK